MNIKQIGLAFGKCIRNPWYIFVCLSNLGLMNHINDEVYLKLIYRARTGEKLCLENPKSYNEKLQWLKLNNQKLEYTAMVDKYEAKKYIAEKIGEGYTIPTLGLWERFEDIDFSLLPKSFVLKCTHDSGGLIICKDKSKLEINAARKIINKSLKKNYFYHGREWPYKNVKHRIIAEQYMEESQDCNESENCLTDYKFFCFHGEPKILYISKDKAENPRTDFFDMDFNHLPIRMRDPNSEILPERPLLFDEMKRIASVLSQGHPHLRVDFYQINGQLYVGELTFYHCSGMIQVKPEEWNLKMGSWIKLPGVDQDV